MEKLPPELLYAILSYFDPVESRHLLRVCRPWFDYYGPIVWKTSADEFLLQVPKERRAIYAPWIVNLVISHGRDRAGNDLTDLTFSRLEAIETQLQFEWNPGHDPAYLKPYMPPTLLSAHLMGTTYASLLTHISTHCPNLRSLYIDGTGPPITTDDLSHPLLLRQLAIHHNLKYIFFFRLITEELIAAANLPSIGHRFPYLSRLALRVDEKALPAIAAAFPTVVDLNLLVHTTLTSETVTEETIVDSAGYLLEHIATTLTNLRYILVTMHEKMMVIPARCFVAFTRLKHLKCLQLYSPIGILVEIPPPITDVDEEEGVNRFRELFAGSDNLETLSFDILPWQTTIEFLVALGQSCPNLKTCELKKMSFNLIELRDYPAPLFPMLTTLAVWDLVEDEDGSQGGVADYVAVISSHFPNLGLLSCFAAEVTTVQLKPRRSVMNT